MIKDFIISECNLQMRKKNLTLGEIAEKCETTRQRVSRLINKGKGNLDLLIKVFKVLEIEFLKKVG